jgi:hypothetical protein
MIPTLTARLAELAALNQTVTYGKLARDLGLTGPSTIARLTTALEALMEEDAAMNHPFRAVLLSGRLANDLPATGFFDKATALNRYDGQDPEGYVAAERAALHSFIGP